MIFRFTLTNSQTLETLEINEPDGWLDSTMQLKRDKKFHSLIEFFDGSFIFYGNNGIVNGGLTFIKDIEQLYGPDASIIMTIEFAPDDFTYEEIFVGQLDLSLLQEMPDNKIRIPIIRDNLWAKFNSRLEIPIDLQATTDLDESVVVGVVDPVELDMTSQTIERISEWEGDDLLAEYLFLPPYGDYLATGTDPSDESQTFTIYSGMVSIKTRDDIQTTYEPLLAFEDAVPTTNVVEFDGESGHVAIDYAFKFDYSFYMKIFNVAAGMTILDDIDVTTTLWTKINEDSASNIAGGANTVSSISYTPVAGFSSTLDNYGTFIEFIGTASVEVNSGDLLYLYARHIITFNYTLGVDDPNSAYWMRRKFIGGVKGTGYALSGDYLPARVTLSFDSDFTPTSARGFLLHDAGAAILKGYGLGVDNPFYSDFLGSTLTNARQYSADGCAWNYTVIRGLQLRGFSLANKPFSISFTQWWDGVEPIIPIGLSYDEISGVGVIRVEERDFFYDETVSVNISNIRDITRKYDLEQIYNKISIGYKVWASEALGGLDDPQTQHIYSTPFERIGQETTLWSDFIAASYAIELTRRKSLSQSEDYKFDDSTFIIAINGVTGSPDNYVPELDENFYAITNLLFPETRYNSRLTPARNFLRWRKWMNGSLQNYLTSDYKFVSGEGNFDMVSTMIPTSPECLSDDNDGVALVESQNIEITDTIAHLPNYYEIKVPMQWDDYKTIRDNRTMAIGISLTSSNHIPLFIEQLDFQPVKGTCKIVGWTTSYFDLTVIEDSAATRDCNTQIPPSSCDDALTTVAGADIVDSDGVCITAATALLNEDLTQLLSEDLNILLAE